MKFKIYIFLGLLAGLWIRWPYMNRPVADWHSHRQADTASVSREYLENRTDWLIPKYHDLSDVQSGLDNPEGFRMVEVPVYNWLTVAAVKLSGIDVDFVSRLISLLMWLSGSIGLYFLSIRMGETDKSAIAAGLTYWLLPFGIFYSTTILPDPTALTFMVWSLIFFKSSWALSAFLLMLSVLIRPYVALVAFPMLAYWSGKELWKKPGVVVAGKYLGYLIIVVIPFLVWRMWILNFSEGIPASAWLFNNSSKAIFPEWYKGYNLTWLNKMVAFRPYWWRWLFYERLGKQILGIFLIVPMILSLVSRRKVGFWEKIMMVLGILIYFGVVAQGNIVHDYYQIIILPFVCLMIGSGFGLMIDSKLLTKMIRNIIVCSVAVTAWWYAWGLVKDKFTIRTVIVEAGEKAKNILPSDSLVVAPYLGDTALLYQTGKRGWPTEMYDIEKHKQQHGDKKFYLVSVNFDNYTNSMRQKYKELFVGDNFIILDLNDEK